MKNKKRFMIYLKYIAVIIAVIIAGAVYFISRNTDGSTVDTFKTDIYHTSTAESSGNESASAENNNAENDGAVIYVYICGQVNEPGVKTCKNGIRLYQLVEMAGGMTETADAAQINLADTVTDGQKVYVPAYGETITIGTGQSNDSSDSGKVNINSATSQELTTLPGIGESRAADIIAYRNTNGKFTSIEEIMNVSGIKDAAYQKLKDLICT